MSRPRLKMTGAETFEEKTKKKRKKEMGVR